MELNISLPFFTMFVTYLHELGHVLGALLTGGSVSSLQVNMDGSGIATTSGGIRSIVEAAGYLGSIVLGNILLRVGIKYHTLSRYMLGGLGLLMMVSSVIWFGSIPSFIFTALCGLVLVLVSRMKNGIPNILIILLGVYSVVSIIADYNVGPTSDLKDFSGFIPPIVWMYIWVAIAISVTIWNAWTMLRK